MECWQQWAGDSRGLLLQAYLNNARKSSTGGPVIHRPDPATSEPLQHAGRGAEEGRQDILFSGVEMQHQYVGVKRRLSGQLAGQLPHREVSSYEAWNSQPFVPARKQPRLVACWGAEPSSNMNHSQTLPAVSRPSYTPGTIDPTFNVGTDGMQPCLSDTSSLHYGSINALDSAAAVSDSGFPSVGSAISEQLALEQQHAQRQQRQQQQQQQQHSQSYNACEDWFSPCFMPLHQALEQGSLSSNLSSASDTSCSLSGSASVLHSSLRPPLGCGVDQQLLLFDLQEQQEAFQRQQRRQQQQQQQQNWQQPAGAGHNVLVLPSEPSTTSSNCTPGYLPQLPVPALPVLLQQQYQQRVQAQQQQLGQQQRQQQRMLLQMEQLRAHALLQSQGAYRCSKLGCTFGCNCRPAPEPEPAPSMALPPMPPLLGNNTGAAADAPHGRAELGPAASALFMQACMRSGACPGSSGKAQQHNPAAAAVHAYAWSVLSSLGAVPGAVPLPQPRARLRSPLGAADLLVLEPHAPPLPLAQLFPAFAAVLRCSSASTPALAQHLHRQLQRRSSARPSSPARGGAVAAAGAVLQLAQQELVAALVWVAAKLEENRKSLLGTRAYAAALRVPAGRLAVLEVVVMHALEWAPYCGWLA